MRAQWMFLSGVWAGVVLMFMLDPDRGRRRRALTRDKMVWAARKTRDGAAATARDVRNRMTGLAAEARSQADGEQPSDEVLVARVRAELGRVCSHPRPIEVASRDGDVTLSGPILAAEADDVLSHVARVDGVRHVENRLDVHETAGDIPGLQGESRRPGRAWLSGRWSPAAQLMAGAGAIVAALVATARCSAGVEDRTVHPVM